MPHSAYPADADVSAFLSASGALLPEGFSTDGLAGAAVCEWESLTGYHPFLAAASTGRAYDPPGPNQQRGPFGSLGGGTLLDLGTGMTAVTSVQVGVVAGDPGTVLQQGSDWNPEPLNALAEGHPFERIRFRFPIFGPPGSVIVTGPFGFCSQLPDDVWQAILRLGAATAMDQISEGQKTRPRQWQEDQVMESWGGASSAPQISEFRQFGRQTALRYMRMGWGDGS